jgi:hypothetical protein
MSSRSAKPGGDDTHQHNRDLIESENEVEQYVDQRLAEEETPQSRRQRRRRQLSSHDARRSEQIE